MVEIPYAEHTAAGVRRCEARDKRWDRGLFAQCENAARFQRRLTVLAGPFNTPGADEYSRLPAGTVVWTCYKHTGTWGSEILVDLKPKGAKLR